MAEDLKKGYPRNPAGAMKRFCQFLKLNQETVDQYKYWHDRRNIWQEIPEGIRRAGIIDMEIYVINDTAFMILETPVDFNWDESFGKLAGYERQSEWEDFVSQFQITADGRRSDEKWELVERIFSLDESLK
ncbi:L-rhamnose mutarotase [Dysgonomonas capnocytophagoides]|uniref:L-rhamnose mutarotase n=1 Tax=Dysgonomonas capnocytophagoides TaxID=45254 RepID=A0A4Y8L1X5_9BACT|nr:L-rhamnose mutarotase [Dysgonomonas capnocytophagoides]TFD94732.1 L-rhamnose mutarotase [Dysgonomonas capnocytophagoides]